MASENEYDRKRAELRQALKACVELARELLDEELRGYEDMPMNYSLDLYKKVREARDAV